MQSLKLTFIMTFLMGFLTGVFVYFSSDLIPEFGSEDETAAREQEEFVIIGEVYGGCQMLGSCPSYRIAASGEYSYLIPERGGQSEVYADALSRARLAALKAQLSRLNLDEISESEFTGTCPAAYDSAAYRYEIVLGGETHRIDTCEHDVANDELFSMLADYFGIFRLTHQGS